MSPYKYSVTAWRIASLYSGVLASETRDLAAHIDSALTAERELCAKIADNCDKSTHPADVADLIRVATPTRA